MAREQNLPSLLRDCWSGTSSSPSAGGAADYTLLLRCGHAYAGRTRAGLPALVVPTINVSVAATGRRASGCEFAGHSSLRFEFEGRTWDGSAATLVCTDPDVVQSFVVFAADIAQRATAETTWEALLATVEEWQTLLAPRGQPSAEEELGLWGELWFLSQSLDLPRALAGWRGPEGDSTDFFVDGVSAEVKTTRKKGVHHVSLAQVDQPVGSHEAWLISLWVKADPAASFTVGHLVDLILARASDQGAALRQIARAGFSPSNRHAYPNRFVILETPEWYAVDSVPRVRAADPGVSRIRYSVTLDQSRCANTQTAARLWRHFHGQDYGDEQ